MKFVSDLPHDGVYLIQHYVIIVCQWLATRQVYLIQHYIIIVCQWLATWRVYLIQDYAMKFVSDLPHMTGVLDKELCYKVCQGLATWGGLATGICYKICQWLGTHDGCTWYTIMLWCLSVTCHMTGVLDTELCYNSLSVTCHMTGCTWYSIML